MAKGLLGGLKGIDAFGKTMEDVKVKTRTGALLTLLSAAFIFTFMTIEFMDYRRVAVDTSIVVDRSRGEKLTVNMNVTFPRVPCFLLSVDVTDISGDVQRDLAHNILKVRLEPSGQPIPNSHSSDLESDVARNNAERPGYCGSCFGAETEENQCCNTCDSVREAYVNRGWSFGNPDGIEQCVKENWSEHLKEQTGEGCNVAGRIRINKVIGNIHLSPGRAFQAGGRNIYDLVPYLAEDGRRHDFTHFIHTFRFEGDDEYDPRKQAVSSAMRKKMGIEDHPLDGVNGRTIKAHYMFQYFAKVVATRFVSLEGKKVNTHQYSVTHFERDLDKGPEDTDAEGTHVSHLQQGLPGAYFNFEISPILVVHSETRQSFAHFLTSTCAIVGGVLTVASLVDSLLFATTRVLKQKRAGGGGGGGGGGAGNGYPGSAKLM